MAGMNIGEFFVALGVSADNKTLKDFTSSIMDLPLQSAAAIASLIGIEYELTKLAGEAMNAAVGFQMFSAETGLSWQELQKWQIVAQQANVSADAVASSVSSLQRQLAEIRLGRGNLAPFQLLGIDPRGNAFQVLEQIRQKIRGMDRATATNLVSQMGITPDMMHLLQLSDAEFARLGRTIHGMSREQEEGFLRAKQSLVQLGLAFKFAGFDIVGHFLAAFEKIGPMLNELHGGFFRFRDVLIALAIYFAPLSAAIAGLVLVLDDLAVYFTGGKSITGLAVEKLKQIGEELQRAFTFPALDRFIKFVEGHADMVSTLMNYAQSGALGPVAAAGATAAVGAATIQQTNNFTITGAGMAVDIANEVARKIAHQTSRAEQQFNNQGH